MVKKPSVESVPIFPELDKYLMIFTKLHSKDKFGTKIILFLIVKFVNQQLPIENSFFHKIS